MFGLGSSLALSSYNPGPQSSPMNPCGSGVPPVSQVDLRVSDSHEGCVADGLAEYGGIIFARHVILRGIVAVPQHP